ncbi:hexapeptide transferase [Spirochaetia bacterium]|nr:hexapeptide transferase [Spirochaetia bacterium]
MYNKLLLVGAGGHCRSVIDSINYVQYSDIGIVDLPEMVGKNIFSIPIVGTDEDIESLFEKGYHQAIITLGSVGNPDKRIKLYHKLKLIGFQFPKIIDSTAIVSQISVEMADGVFVGKGVIINTGVKLGTCAIINSGAIIDHDCEIGQFVHIGPGVRMSGGIHIQDNVHVGIGSSMIQSISVGRDSIIGAGSVVVSDIEEGVIAFGIPCRVYHKGNEVAI